jgi:hypothetical protein
MIKYLVIEFTPYYPANLQSHLLVLSLLSTLELFFGRFLLLSDNIRGDLIWRRIY